MIGVVDVECQAANPNMPLYPMRAFVGSPSSLRLRNVPKRIGDWCIRSVEFTAVYPDGTVKSASCVLTGGVWVGTIEGTQTSGTSKNGYTIFASGTDENGEPVTGYILGKGDIEILEADGTLAPDPTRYYVKLLSAEAETPREGDMYPTEGGYVIWQNGHANQLGTPFEEITAYVDSAISGKADLSAIPTKTSQLSNDSGYITSSQIAPYHDILTPEKDTGIADRAATLAMRDNLGNLDKNGAMTANVTIQSDFTPDLHAKLQYVTYYDWKLTKFFEQTYSPAVELKFCVSDIRRKVGFPRPYYTGYMWRTVGLDDDGKGYAIPCSEEGLPDGRFIEINEVTTSIISFNNDAMVHTITGNANWTSIETIDGQSGQITCTRTNQYKRQTYIEQLANASQVPTATSQLTNDSGFITSADVPTPSYIEDANGNKIEADGDFVKTVPVQDDTVWHFSASFTSPSSSASASGDATYDSENHYWSYTDYYGISLQIYAVEVEGAIEGWRVVGSFSFLSPEGGSILKQFDFQMAGNKYTQSLHYDDNDGFIIDLTRDAITTCKLVTDIDLSAALELKQDKLSEDQISAIDHEVNDLYTHIQTVGGGNYTFKSPSTFNKSILIEQGILAEDGTTWIYPPVTVIMGSNVVVIDSGAFQNATNLLSFRGENVGLFQSNAFSGCTALKTVNIPNATVIGTWMFRYCTNLKTITMPKSVTTISRNAFADSSFDKVFFEGKTLAEVKAMTNYSRWGLAEDKIFTNAFENQLPTKTSDLTNDSGYITADDIITKRDVTDLLVRGNPQGAGSTFVVRNPADGAETLTWSEIAGDWTCGGYYVIYPTSQSGGAYVLNYDGVDIGEFSLDANGTATVTHNGVVHEITGYIGNLVTSNQLISQIAALEARISALENNT